MRNRRWGLGKNPGFSDVPPQHRDQQRGSADNTDLPIMAVLHNAAKTWIYVECWGCMLDTNQIKSQPAPLLRFAQYFSN